jgi:AcrR family transcriptional regulator
VPVPNRASRLDWDAAHGDSPHLSRQTIVSTAIAIADSEGLAAVSIRHVAARLATRPMSLYTYIAAKEDLLALMADEITGEAILSDPLPNDWRAALRMIAGRSHEVFVAHPWVLEIAGRPAHLGHNAIRHAEQLLTAVAPLGLSAPDAWSVLYIVNDYALGHAMRVTQLTKEPAAGYPQFDVATAPHLARALPTAELRRDRDTLETGLDTVLDGIERRFGPGDASGAG